MKRTFALFVFFISLNLFGQIKHNKIDSLFTNDDVLQFLKTNFLSDDLGLIHDNSGNVHFGRSLDSIGLLTLAKLNIRYWEKFDLDENHETDLLIIIPGYNQYEPFFSILSTDNHYEKRNTMYGNFRFKCNMNISCYPKFQVIKNKPFLILFSQYPTYAAGDTTYESGIYTPPFICDTLSFQYGRFINYNRTSSHTTIEKIEYWNDGACEGNCPEIKISINALTNESNCTLIKHEWKEQQRIQTILHDTLDTSQIRQIVGLLTYINFPLLNNRYEVEGTDQLTATLKITFDHGKVKTLTDYGLAGSLTLKEIYNLLESRNWR